MSPNAIIELSNCVVCEEARHEVENKTTLIGFLGVCPQVEVKVADLEKTVERLTLILSGSVRGTGKGLVKFELLDPSGDSVTKINDMPFDVPSGRRITFAQLFIQLKNVKLSLPGQYVIRAYIQDGQTFEASFAVLTSDRAAR
jgi:hypothetical protein